MHCFSFFPQKINTLSFIISRVFAGESFPSFHILSKNVELVAERDMAQDSSTAVVGRDGQSCLKVDASPGNTLPEIQFNIVIKNFYRVEQNVVYKQFFRLVYTVRVSVNGTEYPLKVCTLFLIVRITIIITTVTSAIIIITATTTTIINKNHKQHHYFHQHHYQNQHHHRHHH